MKLLIKNSTRAYARMVANLDGKWKGITQKEAEKALKLAKDLDVAARALNYKSPLSALNKRSIKEAKRMKAKLKKEKMK